ncbi:sulfite exporter TauE/SafE family protein [Paenibacillus sp. OSY-SE]|uniref:sulfite exporter TauE/SafE family protein n=1 Tax=Paenibacillus sp. OSY-SE TaxID=1196323 RepID=UPI0002F87701|nr:sulfite exporter TauE/SafE family protein [Paenibacillus sp. OSY-SE]
MNQTLLLTALSGLMSAPHCVLMCGGTMASFTLNANQGPLAVAAAYNLGRVCTYTLIGAFMGLIGSFVDGAGVLIGLQGISGIMGGLLIMLWVFGKITLPVQRFSPLRLAVVQRWLTRLRGSKERWTILLSGVLFGFMPCGLTYAMQMNAAASGNSWSGAAIMAVFGLSTFPTLLVVALFANHIHKWLRSYMTTAGKVLAVIIGLLSILRGMAANGWIPHLYPWLW